MAQVSSFVVRVRVDTSGLWRYILHIPFHLFGHVHVRFVVGIYMGPIRLSSFQVGGLLVHQMMLRWFWTGITIHWQGLLQGLGVLVVVLNL